MDKNITERIEALEDALQDFRTYIADVNDNLEVFFLVIVGDLVLILQAGFAFLESGVVRSKNTTNILLKNFLDMFISGIAFWLFGYAFSFGEGNCFIGYQNFASQGLSMPLYAKWFYQYVFASTASTIISGSVAERCDFKSYVVYSFMVSGIIYPIVAHWVWQEGGWLKVGDGVHGFRDFAGGGAVHMFGGVCALVGAIILGPRIGRFDNLTGKVIPIQGHSMPLAALGGFIIVFGFVAFNAGSQGHITEFKDGEVIANIVANTIISGSFACITSISLGRMGFFRTSKHWSFLLCLNGCICGMVAICPCGDRVESWGAAVIGFGSGILFLANRMFIQSLKIDDPLDAFAVHFTGGFWGLLSGPFLVRNNGIVYGYGEWRWLLWNFIGVVAISAWAVACSLIMFSTLNYFGLFRVTVENELSGLDILKHGEAAYPVDGWREQQYIENPFHIDTNGVQNGGVPPHMSLQQRTNVNSISVTMPSESYQNETRQIEEFKNDTLD